MKERKERKIEKKEREIKKDRKERKKERRTHMPNSLPIQIPNKK